MSIATRIPLDASRRCASASRADSRPSSSSSARRLAPWSRPPRGALQPELVGLRRPQLRDQVAQTLDLVPDVLERRPHRGFPSLGVWLAQRRGQQDLKPAESLQRLVVELARPAPTLG